MAKGHRSIHEGCWRQRWELPTKSGSRTRIQIEYGLSLWRPDQQLLLRVLPTILTAIRQKWISTASHPMVAPCPRSRLLSRPPWTPTEISWTWKEVSRQLGCSRWTNRKMHPYHLTSSRPSTALTSIWSNRNNRRCPNQSHSQTLKKKWAHSRRTAQALLMSLIPS